jgi:hypothetical protein
VSDDGTVMLVCTSGAYDSFGHGVTAYTPFYHPQPGLVLMRCGIEPAKYYCERAGCHVAPSALQDADR